MIKELRDPRDVAFNNWWDNGGSICRGDLDFPDKERCRKAFNYCLDNFKPILSEFSGKWISEEDSKSPFIERRGIVDNVTKFKCEEAFIAAIQSMIVDLKYKTDEVNKA